MNSITTGSALGIHWKQDEAQHEEATKATNRIVAKAQLEKEAKANGLWDYRNNKIVEEVTFMKHDYRCTCATCEEQFESEM